MSTNLSIWMTETGTQIQDQNDFMEERILVSMPFQLKMEKLK